MTDKTTANYELRQEKTSAIYNALNRANNGAYNAKSALIAQYGSHIGVSYNQITATEQATALKSTENERFTGVVSMVGREEQREISDQADSLRTAQEAVKKAFDEFTA